MISIGEFFKRIGGIQSQEIAFRTGIQTAMKEIIGIDIPIESITFKSGTISLKNISSGARSSIFIKKTAIIEHANQLQSAHKITDIR